MDDETGPITVTPVTGVERGANRTVALLIAGLVISLAMAAVSVVYLARGPIAGALSSLGERAAILTGSVPEWFPARIAADFRGFEVEQVRWSKGASTATTPSVVVWLRSTETTGFRHIAVMDVEHTGADPVAGVPSAPWEWFFTENNLLMDDRGRASFERLWVEQHPDLVCGWVRIDERELPDPLCGYQVEGYSISASGTAEPAGVLFWYRYNMDTGVWDTGSSPDAATAEAPAARPPIEVSDAKARAIVLRDFPAFKVVKVVEYPAIVGPDLGDRFVVLRHPDFAGFLVVGDPLADTPQDTYTTTDLTLDGPLLSRIDTRSRAFMRDWSEAYPGTVVAQFEDFSYTGNSLDYLNISYYPSLAAVSTADTLFEVRFDYDAKRKRWAAPAK